MTVSCEVCGDPEAKTTRVEGVDWTLCQSCENVPMWHVREISRLRSVIEDTDRSHRNLGARLAYALHALALMWNQYCPPPYGHQFMSAGECAADVLENEGLMKGDADTGGEAEELDERHLENAKAEINRKP